jgi:hypothetical protein
MVAKRHPIKSDLARVDKLRDEDIDYSDIPEVDEHVFGQPSVSWPPRAQPPDRSPARNHDPRRTR